MAVRLEIARGRAHRGLRTHRRHADRRPGLPGRHGRTGCACPASTRTPSSPACWAPRNTASGGSAPRTAPATEPPAADRRRYRGDSLILESEWDTPRGTVRVTDFMPPRDGAPQLIRIVEGVSGRVPMRSALRMRFSYGRVVPWVHKVGQPHGRRRRARTRSGWTPRRRRTARTSPRTPTSRSRPASGSRSPSAGSPRTGSRPRCPSPRRSLEATEDFWREWVEHCTYHGPYREAVVRSLITLKALTYAPDRRHRGRAHDLAARGHRRRTQLGLPLHLAARRRDHALLAAAHRLPRGGPRLARVAAARGRGRPGEPPDHVRHRRRARARRGGAGLAARATRARPRSGSATAPPTSSSWTCTARSPRRCTWRT